MAIFIPSLQEDFNSSYGEKKVYESFRALDNNYVVFHSLNWVSINQRDIGEADFVVMHPDKGILVIEVKAGEIKYNLGEWTQTNTKTRYMKRIDPFNQAKKSQFEIIDRLNSRIKGFRTPLTCHCVWFTSVIISKRMELPPESPREIVLDEKSLETPKQAIDGAFDFWIRKKNFKTKLDPSQYKEVINVLCPYFHAVPRLKTTGDEVEQLYIKLTNQQVALLNFLEEQDTAVIHGLAGTGKTVLAIEKAKLLAEQDETVLFLCFNSFLKDHLKENYGMPNVVYHNVHSLAYEFMKYFDVEINELEEEFVDYLEIIFETKDWKYLNVIIDEGQDINERLLIRLYELTKEKMGYFYVFYDRNQFVMKNHLPEWIEKAECKLVLHKNCRNTAEVFKTSCSVLGIEDFSKMNDIHGETPNVIFYESEKNLINIVTKFIRGALNGGLLKEEIVILSATTMEKTWLNIDESYAGCQLAEKFNKDKILFTTIRKFKGLEAKAVLLIDVSMSELSKPEIRRLVYVGCSRAKYLLSIATLEDLDSNEFGDFLRQMNPLRNVPKNKKGFSRLLNVNL